MDPTGDLKGYAILNKDLNRFLTSASGKGLWQNSRQAKDVLNTEFGGDSHLSVVEVRSPDEVDAMGKLQIKVSDWLTVLYEGVDEPDETPAAILLEEESGLFVARLEKEEVDEIQKGFGPFMKEKWRPYGPFMKEEWRP